MDSPENRTITRRLVFSFFFLILIFLFYSLYSLYDARKISGLTRKIYDHPLVVSNAALQANVCVTRMHRNMKDVVLFESLPRVRQSVADVGEQEKLAYLHLNIVRGRILGEEGKNLERQTRALFDAWRPIREEVISLVAEGKKQEAAEITRGKGAAHVAKLEEKMGALNNYARAKASSFIQEAQQTHSRLNISSIIFLVLALSVSFLIALFTLRRTALAEKEIRESRQLLDNAIDHAPIGMILVEPGGKFFRVNEAFRKITGYSDEDLSRMNVREISLPEERDKESEAARQLMDGELERSSLETRWVKKDQSPVDVFQTTSLLRDANGSPLYFFTQVKDISERKLAEKRIRHLNQVLRGIRDVDQLIVRETDRQALVREGCRLLADNRGYRSVLVVLTDTEDRPEYWAAEGSAADSRELADRLEKESLPPCCARARKEGRARLIEETAANCSDCPIAGVCMDCHSLCAPLLHEGQRFGYLAVASEKGISVDEEELELFNEMAGDFAYALHVIDVKKIRIEAEEEKNALQTQLVQAQKMEAIGKLAGGVAHDFNNMLSVILGHSEMALEEMTPEQPLYQVLEEIHKAGKHSADLTRQLLGFARRQTIAPRPLDLNDAVGGMLNMLRPLIGEDIDLAWIPGPGLWQVELDPGQLDQILANLCINSRDAIAGSGKVTLETHNMTLGQDYCDEHMGSIPGDYVMLAVSDNGCGMDKATLNRIFEPFFTTKESSLGTGLGLATVYGIVKQNQGFINVYSEPGKGSTFRIYLSRHDGPGQETEASPPFEGEIFRGQEETVLLVEDEAAILKMGISMLERLGYRVMGATAPWEAIHLAEEHKADIHLLVTDVVMPEMNGRELAERLKATYPDIKTLYMSGYTANVIAHHGVLEEGVHFLQKPFSFRSIAYAASRALTEKTGPIGEQNHPASLPEKNSPEKNVQTGGKILIIEDERQIRKMLCQVLEAEGFEVTEASDGNEGLRLFRKNPADLVITDIIMPEKEGVEVIMAIKKDYPEVKIFAISGGGLNKPDTYLSLAKNMGADRTFSKPFEIPEFMQAVFEIFKETA